MWTYTTSLKWNKELIATSGSEGKPPIDVTSPPEFGGTAGTWTPEDLLVSAVESCMLLTTLSIVGRQKIGLTSYESKAVGKMEKTPEGLRFQSIEIEVKAAVSNAGDVDRLKKAVNLAEKYCPVSNALKIPLHISSEVRS